MTHLAPLSSLQLSPGRPFPCGVSYTEQEVNLALFGREISTLSLLLFSDPQSPPYKRIPLNPLQHRTGEIWHFSLPLNHLPLLYRFELTRGEQNFPSILDPHARLIHTPSEWGTPSYQPTAELSLPTSFDWKGDRPPHIPLEELIIYEAHVRGFTQDPSSMCTHRGSYLGIIEKIPHLKALGINAIELLPVFEFQETAYTRKNPHNQEQLYNYWGYSPVSLFAPMNRYRSLHHEMDARDQFRTLVRELHKEGIEVILDVVYNHTCEADGKEHVYSFFAWDPHTYYILGDQGEFQNYSGCGNTLNANHPITSDLILESLRYWVSEMHVDGFRFDLGSILTRGPDGSPLSCAPTVERITQDPLLAQTKLICEPWDAAGLYQVGSFHNHSSRWSEWNGRFRDTVRRFIKGDPHLLGDFARRICGSEDLYKKRGSPSHSIHFITAHDGFSLRDLVSYQDKHNLENGEQNRDGCSFNDSWNCGTEGETEHIEIQQLRLRQMKNFHLALMVSLGVPMVLMGDEYGHSRKGNNNSWCQDNRLNWMQWDTLEEEKDFFRFYSQLIHYRKGHPLLARKGFFQKEDVSWHGHHPLQPHWEEGSSLIAFTLHGKGIQPDTYVAFNAFDTPQTIELPQGEWRWVAHTAAPSPLDFFELGQRPFVEKKKVELTSHSSLILESPPL